MHSNMKGTAADHSSRQDHTPDDQRGWYDEPLPADHRSGFVAVVGRPNVGKSSLMNAYLGQKVAIVSPKPQTTRNRLLGILTRRNVQLIFIDTPGIHRPQHKLGKYMLDTAISAIPDADIALFVVDVSSYPTEADRATARLLSEQPEVPRVLALNKMDLVKPSELPARAAAYCELGAAMEWLPVSATRGDNLSELLSLLLDHLPLGPRLYPPDQVTDQQERFISAELIREQVFVQTHQEVPYGVAVAVEEFKERRPDLTYIGATIYVERDSHKGIIIGKDGERLKEIGQRARKDIEAMLDHAVYLELWVKVREKWRQDDRQLRDFGYAN
jgi:GTPase